MYFQIYISFSKSLISASRKTCTFYVNEISSAHACATPDESVWLQLLASPLTKWNLPVPCKLGRETRYVLQNWKGIFPTSSVSVSFEFETRIMSTCMSTLRSNYFDMSIWKKHADHSTRKDHSVCTRTVTSTCTILNDFLINLSKN